MNKKTMKRCFFAIIVLAYLTILIAAVYAVPVGPTVSTIENRTRIIAGNTTLNESQNGGYIYYYIFDVVEQNKRWKAYIGNVTGTLTLDDTNGYTIYDWNLGAVSGEVYATRSIDTVNWSGITCANVSNLKDEDTAMSHSKLDNITQTFSTQNHPSFTIGSIPIAQDACFSILTYVNQTSQSSTEYFPEIALKDNSSKIVFATKIENDVSGYDGSNATLNNTYDFQMLVPENGLSTWDSATAYYFYVELG